MGNGVVLGRSNSVDLAVVCAALFFVGSKSCQMWDIAVRHSLLSE